MGRAILEKFCLEGRRVIAIDDDRHQLKELIKDFKKRGYEADYAATHLSDPTSIKRSLRSLLNRFSPLDTLILNGAPSTPLTFEESTDKP